MDAMPIVNSLAFSYPKSMAAFRANEMQPHENADVASIIHLVIQRIDFLNRAVADLAKTNLEGQSLTFRLEAVMEAEVKADAVRMMMHPVEKGIADGLDAKTILTNVLNYVHGYALGSELPTSSSGIHNARAVMALIEWRTLYRVIDIAVKSA